MSNPPEPSWSDDPNAPQIPLSLHLIEKDGFAGLLIATIFYGIVIGLFFRCMGVLLSPVNHTRRAIKCALIAHTVAMFSFVTIPVGIDLKTLSICYIDDREFPSNSEYPPGPMGCEALFSARTASSATFYAMFPLNQWLADGLLLHRCYVIFSMNYWAMALPSLMYLASIGMGIMYIYERSTGGVDVTSSNTAYFSISLSLNVLLTLMIITRLILHIRNIRKTIGAPAGSSGLHIAATTVVTMLVESYSLYAISFLLYLVTWAIDPNSPVVDIFSKPLGHVQVIAPYLIIVRVAKRRALTNNSISGSIDSIQFRSQGTADSDGTLPDGDPMASMEVNGEAGGGLGAGTEDAIEEVPS